MKRIFGWEPDREEAKKALDWVEEDLPGAGITR